MAIINWTFDCGCGVELVFHQLGQCEDTRVAFEFIFGHIPARPMTHTHGHWIWIRYYEYNDKDNAASPALYTNTDRKKKTENRKPKAKSCIPKAKVKGCGSHKIFSVMLYICNPAPRYPFRPCPFLLSMPLVGCIFWLYVRILSTIFFLFFFLLLFGSLVKLLTKFMANDSPQSWRKMHIF